MMYIFRLTLVLTAFFLAAPAYAACTSPTAGPGDVIYNFHNSVLQFCNDTTWVAMGGDFSGGGGGSGDDLGTHVATENLEMSGFNIDDINTMTISDYLLVDTNTLVVDNDNDRVGIGTTTPSMRLFINGGNLALKETSSGGVDGWVALYMDSDVTNASKSLFIHYGGSVTGPRNNELRFGRLGNNFGAWEANPLYFDLDAPEAAFVLGSTGWLSVPGGFSGVGSSLTSLNASNLASGTVPTARLGGGTANNTTYLRGDNNWATPATGGSNCSATSVSATLITGSGYVCNDVHIGTTTVSMSCAATNHGYAVRCTASSSRWADFYCQNGTFIATGMGNGGVGASSCAGGDADEADGDAIWMQTNDPEFKQEIEHNKATGDLR